MRISFIAVFCGLLFSPLFAQLTERPFIWVKASDRPALLEKIATEEWARSYFEKFRARADEETADYRASPVDFLRQLPLDWRDSSGSVPPFLDVSDDRKIHLMHTLQLAIDCGVLYFLTEEPQYGRFSADVLYTLVEAYQRTPLQMPVEGNSGWLLSDHLREAREIGAQLPILYDLAAPYLAAREVVTDPVSGQEVPFPLDHAQFVFRSYVKLALERGLINNNWPVLESPSLVGNLLALDDPEERDRLLPFYLSTSGDRQDALAKVAAEYRHYNNDWPESFNYSRGVASFSSYLMTLLTRYDPALHLGQKYPYILLALPRPYYFTYPNRDEVVIFGDGHRGFHPALREFETAYHLAEREGLDSIRSIFGSLLTTYINSGEHDRARLPERNFRATFYRDPLQLLWFEPSIEGENQEYPLPVTDELPFAGIVLQRNLSTTGKVEDAMMGFVGGGGHVHGHVSGMHMELFGKGHVLGQKGGRSQYRTEIHENYYRIYASHNTVVVNGASKGHGGWVNLGMDPIQKVALEPAVNEAPVSPNYSFSVTAFVDTTKGVKAKQQRTLGVIRTSPTSGYFVDVFRSESQVPNQFHDYIYHNIGDSLYLFPDDPNLDPVLDPDRYRSSGDQEWVQNRRYRNPGWHYFQQVETLSGYARSLNGFFRADKLGSKGTQMQFFVPGNDSRDYSRVLAPPSKESLNVYAERPTPSLVIRQRGSAWATPFALVFEPTSGDTTTTTVRSVTSLKQAGKFQGLVVKSKVDGKQLTQYIISADRSEAEFHDANIDLAFKGRYAVLTVDGGTGEAQSLYLGEGSQFFYRGMSFKSENDEPTSLFLDFRTTIDPATIPGTLSIPRQ